MTDQINELLISCGYDRIKNSDIQVLITEVKNEYNIPAYNNPAINEFLKMYNGLTVDASAAIRKSMKIYSFHGGFQISLQYVLQDKDYLHDEFDFAGQSADSPLFPIGNAFGEILCISESNKIYVGEKCAAENWEEFLSKLINDEYADL